GPDCDLATGPPSSAPSQPPAGASVPRSAEDWLPFLMAAADRADEIALHFFRNPGLRVDTKPDLSPVTEADRVIEAMARRLVRDTHPALGESGAEEGEPPGTAGLSARVARRRGLA